MTTTSATSATTSPVPLVHLSVPPRWRRRADPEHGVLVAARAPLPPPSGVPPEIVLRWTPVDTDLAAWRQSALGQLRERLRDFELDDSDEYELGGEWVAYHRFAHLVGLVDVVCEQWAWLADGVGLTLTCSVAREQYETHADLFEEVAGSTRIERLPAA